MNNLELVIGIEIHIELNTKTKMFSPAPNQHDGEPNTNVHPIDLGYPGTLPLVNKEAIIKAIKLAKALNMEIDPNVKFDRKHYFYPDLPKGFQITQQFFPIGKNGKLHIDVNGKKEEILIERIHMEEDTAKQHIFKNQILYDFNRAGVPLIEIVTAPVIKSAEMATAYVDTIRKVALALDISEARMDQGKLRADINISVRPIGYNGFGTRVEIKNMNSLANIKKAIEAEYKHQVKAYLNNFNFEMSTKRFDEATQDVVVMRTKTDAVDYRYFREPNIPTIVISQKEIDEVILNELPWEKELRYLQYGLNDIQITALINDLSLANYFDSINYFSKSKLANIFFSEIISMANKLQVHPLDLEIKVNDLEQSLKLLDEEEISTKNLKILIPLLSKNNKEIKQLILENNLKVIKDRKVLSQYLEQIIKDNENFVKEYDQRPERVLKMISGQLMKITNGQAHPVIANEILVNLLKK